MAEGDDAFPRPLSRIVPSPCGEEVNRNWDAVREIINNIVNNYYLRGSLIAEIALVPVGDECAGDPVATDPDTFRPLFQEDPANPMIRPTEVYNPRGLGILNSDKAYIVFDPNDPSMQRWEIMQVDHTEVDVLSDATFTAGLGINFEGVKIRAQTCEPIAALIPTVTARAIRALELSGTGGCSIISNEIELEVLGATDDSTDYVEITFDSLQVLTDVYQDGAYGNIYGYYYQVYAPCINLVGPDLLIYVDTCHAMSGGG